MASSGCAGARTGSVGWRATAWPNASVVEKIAVTYGSKGGRDVRPDRCWRKRPSKGHAGIRYWLRTRGRDLRIHRNHANPPRFERQSTAYKCITGVLQHAGAKVVQGNCGALPHGATGTSRFLNSKRSNHKLNAACSVVVAIDKYQTCSMRKPGLAESQINGSPYMIRRAPELNSAGLVLPNP